MLAPNSTPQNRYRIVRELGHGGMGTVYEAIDQRVSCVVALKQTLVGANTPAREAFQREAALLANLRHASLPKVMDYFSEGDGEFLVMEYIAGHDLAELLEQQQTPFSQDQVLAWADDLLKLLDYLHTREPPIVHRDIKPANLKITSEGEIFLLDFGLAKGAAGQMATVRTGGSVHGYTPLYAPLEQIHGQGTDPRTDIYSLGATLYDLLTGQPPVAAPVRFDAIENERPDPLPPANRLNSRVSSVVAEVIQQAMALSRRNRFSSAAEMRDALQRAKQTMADLDAARKAAEKAMDKNRAQIDPDKPIVTDSNVQFTVYSPRQIKPQKNYALLAFAHLAKKRDDAPADEPDPIEEMKDQAARILGKQQADYDNANEPSGQPVPREGELTFVPIVPGITFSPATRTFTWRKSVHREEFDLWVEPDLDNTSLSGQMTVFLGSLVIAEVPLKISVNSRAKSAAEKISLDEPQSGRRLRQVFASYSHQDEHVVAELAHVAPMFGSQFITDRTHLMPGEDRSEGMKRLIGAADAFQLFWSNNSMRSADVINEIDYAISLNKKNFILPTYWEEPLPRSPQENLPPEELERLHFFRIYPGSIQQAMNETALGSRSRQTLTEPVLMPSADLPTARFQCTECKTPSYRSAGFCYRCGNTSFEPVNPRTRPLESAGASHASHRGEPIDAAYFGQGSSTPFGSPDEADAVAMTGELPQIQNDVADTAPLELPASPVEPMQSQPPSYHRRSPSLGGLRTPEAAAMRPAATARDSDAGGPLVAVVFCAVCGMKLAPDIKFCSHCGSDRRRPDAITQPLSPPAQAMPPTGRPQPAETIGSPSPKMTSEFSPVTPMPAAVAKRKFPMTPIYAGAALMLLVVLVAPAWIMLSMYSGSKSTTIGPSGTPLTNRNLNSSNSNSSGDAAPDLSFTMLDGRTQALKDFRGRVVLLNFWATWAIPSKREVPVLNSLEQRFASRGLVVIGISNDDTAEKIKDFQKENPQNYQIGMGDKAIARQLGILQLPTTYIIDRRGKIRKKFVGVGDQSAEAFAAAIQPLLDEAP